MPESRNWADLPRELVHLICKKLPADRICANCFRAVCKNWLSFAPLSDRRPQLPWLIERDNDFHFGYLGPNLRFDSLASSDTGTIHVPEAYCGMKFYGPGHGQLLVSSAADECYLLNLLTANVISLTYLNNYFLIVSPVCSSSDPSQNWHVVSCHSKVSGREWRSLIYHPDCNNWTCVNIDWCHKLCNTCCCWDGKLYATEKGCSTGENVFNYNDLHRLEEKM